ELQGLMRLYDQAVRDELPYEQAIQVPLMAVLISPRFLFRVEIDPPDKAAEGVRALNDYELASRLSYFLWSSMPDDELFRLAEQRQLQTSEVRRQQVERMLRDGRARALVDSFAMQWLQLRRLDMVTPDSDYFPEFSAELRKDMHEETRRFVAAIIEEDRPLTDLLDADFTFV